MPGWCGVVSARSVDVSIRSLEKFKRPILPCLFLYLFLYFVPEVLLFLVFPVFFFVFWSRSYIYPCLSSISSCILVQKLYLSLYFLYFFLYFGPEVVSILVFPVFLLVFWSRSCIYPCISCISSCIFSLSISSKGFYSFPPQESSSIKNTKILINVPKFSFSSCSLPLNNDVSIFFQSLHCSQSF